MEKLQGFFQSLLKNKSLEGIGGMNGMLEKISALSKDGQIDLSMLKKLVMPYANNFMPGSVSKFFKDNKGKTEVPQDQVLDFFRSNMKQDSPATPTNGHAEADKPDVQQTPAAEATS